MMGFSRPALAGYNRIDNGVAVLTPWTSERPKRLPGEFEPRHQCRGEQLFRGPRRPVTHGLQRANCVDTGEDGEGFSLTLPAAAKGLEISFENIGKFAIDIYAAPKPQHAWDPWAVDSLDGQANDVAFVLAAGAKVTFKCDLNGKWTS